jgi:hypothetical protein
MYLIDTDVLSELRKPRPADNVVHWMRAQQQADLFLSAITIMEIERGIEKQRGVDPQHAAMLDAWPQHNLASYGDHVLAITSAIAQRRGRMQIQLKRNDDDLAIAATALEHGFQVVTRNVRDFTPMGVAILNPFDFRP